MTTNAGEITCATLDDEAVAAYLKQYPDFLSRYPDVLAALEVPHRTAGGPVVSLIERQVAVLRERNERLEHRLAELLRTARSNERVGARLLALGRGLLEADSLDAALATVRDALLNEFAADEVALRLIDTEDGRRAADEPARFLRPGDPAVTVFDEFLRRGEPVCGDVTAQQLSALFGRGADEVGSAALVPLRAGRALGIVGLGSSDASHFRADMGTLFLGQLGDLVSAGIARHLHHS